MRTTKDKLITWLILFLIGIYFMIVGKTTLELKIIHDYTGSTAQIHRASCIEPFKTVDINIPNLKCAIVVQNPIIRLKHGKRLYKIELESFDGKRTSLSPFFYSIDKLFIDCNELQNRINDSITNKTDFQYTGEQTLCFMFGGIFMAMSFIIFVPNKHRVTRRRQRKIEDTLFYICIIACIIFFFACIYFFNPL